MLLRVHFSFNFLRRNSLLQDAEVKKADDYDQMDMMSLLDEEQIQTMLDTLYSRLVNEQNHGSVSVSSQTHLLFNPQLNRVSFTLQFADLFFVQIVPEWALAIFMEKFAMDRKKAIERIQQQNLRQNNQVDDSEILIHTQNSFDVDD